MDRKIFVTIQNFNRLVHESWENIHKIRHFNVIFGIGSLTFTTLFTILFLDLSHSSPNGILSYFMAFLVLGVYSVFGIALSFLVVLNIIKKSKEKKHEKFVKQVQEILKTDIKNMNEEAVSDLGKRLLGLLQTQESGNKDESVKDRLIIQMQGQIQNLSRKVFDLENQLQEMKKERKT